MLGVDGVVLYFDDGPAVGWGHRRRMEALARALNQLGVDTECLPVRCHHADDPRVRVVDSYLVRADDERFMGAPVVAIDDLDRDLAVDLVVHPAPLQSRHPGQSAAIVLHGFQYSLLVPVTDEPTTTPPSSAVVLVTLGASDTVGWGAAIASLIADKIDDVFVMHAPGRWSTRCDSSDVMTIDPEVGLGNHLVDSTVVVTAGGVTMLESLALGKPTVVVTTADNQVPAVSAIAEAEAAIVVPMQSGPGSVVEHVSELLNDEQLRDLLSHRAAGLVDFGGANRVANAIVGVTGGR